MLFTQTDVLIKHIVESKSILLYLIGDLRLTDIIYTFLKYSSS